MAAIIKLTSTDSTAVTFFWQDQRRELQSMHIETNIQRRRNINSNNKQKLQTSGTAVRNATTKLNLIIQYREIKIDEESYESIFV